MRLPSLHRTPNAGRLVPAALLAACACAAHAGTATGSIAINLTIVSVNSCHFSTPPPKVMDFGVLDLTRTTAITLTAPAQFKCGGKTNTVVYATGIDNGLHFNGTTRRMQHSTSPTDFLPYTASVSPGTGSAPKGTPVDLTITATIPVASFQQAVEGLYSDTIILTVQP